MNKLNIFILRSKVYSNIIGGCTGVNQDFKSCSIDCTRVTLPLQRKGSIVDHHYPNHTHITQTGQLYQAYWIGILYYIALTTNSQYIVM